MDPSLEDKTQVWKVVRGAKVQQKRGADGKFPRRVSWGQRPRSLRCLQGLEALAAGPCPARRPLAGPLHHLQLLPSLPRAPRKFATLRKRLQRFSPLPLPRTSRLALGSSVPQKTGRRFTKSSREGRGCGRGREDRPAAGEALRSRARQAGPQLAGGAPGRQSCFLVLARRSRGGEVDSRRNRAERRTTARVATLGTRSRAGAQGADATLNGRSPRVQILVAYSQ